MKSRNANQVGNVLQSREADVVWESLRMGEKSGNSVTQLELNGSCGTMVSRLLGDEGSGIITSRNRSRFGIRRSGNQLRRGQENTGPSCQRLPFPFSVSVETESLSGRVIELREGSEQEVGGLWLDSYSCVRDFCEDLNC